MRPGAPTMDRRFHSGWIIGLTLTTALGAFATGCSSVDESGSESQAATSRWSLTSDARNAGSQVRIPYESAPLWNGGRSCGGSLRSGSKALGRELLTRFAQVKSIGGYSCRRNTADGARMSVHGTGKALDVFVPTRSGRANSEQGDAVANWLVANAAEIGVQLIIWNRSVWRSNGSNEKPYGGPVPHIDHLHVELTEHAARKLTPWFEQHLETGDDADGGTTTEPDVDAAAPIATKDAGHAPDATTPSSAKDAGLPPVVPADAAPPVDHEEEDDYDPELDTDGPGEEDSLGTGAREVPVEYVSGPPITCAATASLGATTTTDETSALGSLALALAVTIVRRRRREDREERHRED